MRLRQQNVIQYPIMLQLHDQALVLVLKGLVLFPEEDGLESYLEETATLRHRLRLSLTYAIDGVDDLLPQLAPALLEWCRASRTQRTVPGAIEASDGLPRFRHTTGDDYYNALVTCAKALVQRHILDCNDIESLWRAIPLFREAVYGPGDGLYETRNDNRDDSRSDSDFDVLCSYWDCLGSLAIYTGDIAVHEANLHIGQRVVALISPDDGRRYLYLNNLGVAYMKYFQRTEEPKALETAVTLFGQSIAVTPADVSTIMMVESLATALACMGEMKKDIVMLDQAEHLSRQVLQDVEAYHSQPLGQADVALDENFGTMNRCNVLTNLATVLNRLYKLVGSEERIEEAIDLYEAAIKMDVETARTRTHYGVSAMNNLATALHHKYQVQNDIGSLDEAISIYRQALALYPLEHAFHLSSLLNTMLAYQDLFACRGRVKNIDTAIELGERMMAIIPSNHSAWGEYGDVLALAYYNKFCVTGDMMCLRNARDLHLDAVEAATEEMERILPLPYSILGRRKFDLVQDLQEAVNTQRFVLEATPSHHGAYIWILVNTASDMAQLFEQLGDSHLLEEAIGLCQPALDATMNLTEEDPKLPLPITVVNRCKLRVTLALLYLVQHSQRSPLFDLEKAAELVEDIVSDLDLTPRVRLHDARTILDRIELAAASHVDSVTPRFEEIMSRVYGHVVENLPLVASFGLNRSMQLDELEAAESLGSNAARYLARTSNPSAALELLEQARAVVWSQALRIRDPQIDDLPDDIAHELRTLLTKLNESDMPIVPAPHTIHYSSSSISRTRQSARVVELLAQARALPGMDRFFRGYSAEKLKQSAVEGPVVILVDSAAEAFAIIVSTPNADIRCVSLPSVTKRALERWTACMSGTYNTRGQSRRATCADDPLWAMRAMYISHPRQGWNMNLALREMYHFIVAPIIDVLKFPVRAGSSRTRLHWCPTGRFTFLPIHAAGIYADADTKCGSNHFVSSYTPTLTALVDARRSLRPLRRQDLKALIVGEAASPGFSLLSGVADEVAIVRKLISSASASAVNLDEVAEGMTVDTLLKMISSANVLHLACHGVQHDTEPLQSGFALRDGILTVSSLMDLHAPSAFMAFLSACETAKGDEHQPDQAVHLAAAMLFAGFRNVVATMWTMGDQDGPLFAQKVYQKLLEQELIDAAGVASAVDYAVGQLRSLGLPPTRWATFIHVGA